VPLAIFSARQALGEIEPALLGDLTRAIRKALVQANAEESKPPGLLKLLSTFETRFPPRVGRLNDLLVAFGRNLTEKEPAALV